MFYKLSSFCLRAGILSCVLSCSLWVTAAPAATPDLQLVPTQDFPLKALQDASKASQSWLSIVDRNQYPESWDRLSSFSKLTVRKEEWIRILEKTRRPLGSVTSRQILDERTAKDPSGLPKGDYIVMFYKTQFSHKTAFELVTLYLEDGQWLVATYEVDSKGL